MSQEASGCFEWIKRAEVHQTNTNLDSSLHCFNSRSAAMTLLQDECINQSHLIRKRDKFQAGMTEALLSHTVLPGKLWIQKRTFGYHKRNFTEQMQLSVWNGIAKSCWYQFKILKGNIALHYGRKKTFHCQNERIMSPEVPFATTWPIRCNQLFPVSGSGLSIQDLNPILVGGCPISNWIVKAALRLCKVLTVEFSIEAPGKYMNVARDWKRTEHVLSFVIRNFKPKTCKKTQ